MFTAWWLPFSRYGVIHGDPHLGNYTVFEQGGEAGGINLLDYGCIRIFPPNFVGGVVDLYAGCCTATTIWSCTPTRPGASRGCRARLIDILNIWAQFIYGPLLDDRVRTIADGVKPSEYGRREAFRVHQALQGAGPVTVPREFVFMDRAAIGLGGVFLHLDARLNFYRLFNEAIEKFSARRGGRAPERCVEAGRPVRGRRSLSGWPLRAVALTVQLRLIPADKRVQAENRDGRPRLRSNTRRQTATITPSTKPPMRCSSR